MKKIKIISVMLLLQVLTVFSFKLSAQQYYPLVDTNKLWSMLIMEVYPGWPQFSYYIKFTEDTTINSTVYKKVMQTYDSLHVKWINDGYIRETADKKVYYLTRTYATEGLLYNFNLKKGDTISIRNLDLCTVDSINNILIGKQIRKSYYLSGSYQRKEVWIEGIGSLCGLLTVGGCINIGTKNALLCYTENDTLKYMNPAYNYCFYGTVNVKEIKKNKIKCNIYPNPVYQQSAISYQLTVNSLVTIKIYDVLGNEIEMLVNKNQDIGEHKVVFYAENINNGIYFYKLMAGSYSSNGKIIVIKN